MKDYVGKIIEATTTVIAIDFDKVIHKNSKGYHDGTIYDDPVEGVKEALEVLSKKYTLVVFTCKAKPSRPFINGKGGRTLVWEWLRKHDLVQYISEVTHEKPWALYYIDDKAIKFTSWDQVLEEI